MRARRSRDRAPLALRRAGGGGRGRRRLDARATLPRAAPGRAVQPETAASSRRAGLPGRPAHAGNPAPAQGLTGLGAPARAAAPRGPGRARAGARARMNGASSWSFREEDAARIGALLNSLLREANARTAL